MKQGDPNECGDVWLFVALAATQKAVLSYVVGKRTAEKPSSRRGALDCLLQSVPRARNTALHASYGAWRDRSHLDDWGACAGRACAVRRAAIAALDARNDNQARLSTV